MSKIYFAIIGTFIPLIMISQNVWQPVSSFSGPRNTHTLTVLPDGNVLQVAGDLGFLEFTNIVELYDPVTDTWVEKSPYPLAVSDHRAMLTSDNTVIIFGGANASGSVSSVYEYNIAEDNWTQKSDMPYNAVSKSVVELSDGKILISGGWSQPSYTVSANSYVYDPQTDTYSENFPMPSPLTNHIGVLLSDGKVLIAGGYNGNGGSNISAIFDPETMSWSATGNLLYPTSGGGKITALAAGKALFVGGFDFTSFSYYDKISEFDIATGEWTEKISLDYDFSNGPVHALPNGKVIIIGGSNGSKSVATATYPLTIHALNGIFPSEYRATLNAVMIYDPETNVLAEEESLPQPRFGGASAQYPNGNIMITGGAAASLNNSYDDGLIYQYPFVTDPIITVSESALDFGIVPYDTISQVLTFVISGEDLLDNIDLTSTENFEISDASDEGFGNSLQIPQVEGIVDNFTVYARFAPNAVQMFSGEILITSTGAESLTITLVGEGTTVINVISHEISLVKIFPNPGNGTINVECDGRQQLEILDIYGKVIESRIIENQATIKLPDAGVFFVKLSTGNTFTVERIIVK